MKILVTGGLGFIGSHLVDKLISEEHQVWIVDDRSNCRVGYYPAGATINVLDICETEKVRDIIISNVIEVVVHLAAISSVEVAEKNPDRLEKVNISATLDLLDMCRELKAKCVFASSAAIYGNSEKDCEESDGYNPLSLYGKSKAFIDEYITTSNVDAIALRFSNVYGVGQNANSPYSGVISVFSSKLKKNEKITIHGDGLQVRDFINVKDVVRMIANVIKIHAWLRYRSLNISTGNGISVMDLAWTMAKAIPCKLNMETGPFRSRDIKSSILSVRKRVEVIGYHELVKIEDGVKELLCGKQPSR